MDEGLEHSPAAVANGRNDSIQQSTLTIVAYPEMVGSPFNPGIRDGIILHSLYTANSKHQSLHEGLTCCDQKPNALLADEPPAGINVVAGKRTSGECFGHSVAKEDAFTQTDVDGQLAMTEEVVADKPVQDAVHKLRMDNEIRDAYVDRTLLADVKIAHILAVDAVQSTRCLEGRAGFEVVRNVPAPFRLHVTNMQQQASVLSPVPCTQDAAYNSQPLHCFYDESELKFNVHNVVYLCDDIRLRDPRDTVPAFPFE
ncbi:hypothetical protein EG68_05045 [Paragonimus skrjabini miyazakii]|uniref:Uncharacterized protein n=1 Tax=Paragonimus skrjabini miyazakii TaxID=59628 RepID=A0A8S9YY76_9TREM|nr:hypothetical protein EG68_05045 [Paragonimus skrjabini miyazakii]